jgi:tetratricopeptide (TPR) repeat protein
VIEDTMFFPRLRRQAKWMFLFLALVFGIGFVGFGVGAGGIGLGNIVQGGGDSGIPSIESAEERIAENPNDVQAHRDLATAHQANGDTDQAILALENLLLTAPRDVDALREVAALYLAKASEAQQEASLANARASLAAPGATLAGAITIGGQPLEPDVISNIVYDRLYQAVNAALTEAQDASTKAVDTYRRLTRAQPRDPNVQLELAQAAQNAGDIQTAIDAYDRFLELAPQDPTAPDVRRILRQLRQSQSPAAPSG